MVDTANKFLNRPSTGGEVGTWGNSYNENMVILDRSLGGTASITLTNLPVVLSSGEYQNVFLSFSGILSASVTVTLPSVGSFYSVNNLTLNSSIYNVVLTTGAGQSIGAPPGRDFVDIMTDGTNVKYRNMGRIGSYVDMGSTGVPGWIAACTVRPYLYCNGGTFSSATYPVLTTILGSTTLPDCRGRARFDINSGSTRLANPINGDTLFAAGGADGIALFGFQTTLYNSVNLNSSATTGTSPYYSLAGNVAIQHSNIPTGMIHGITMIRAG